MGDSSNSSSQSSLSSFLSCCCVLMIIFFFPQFLPLPARIAVNGVRAKLGMSLKGGQDTSSIFSTSDTSD